MREASNRTQERNGSNPGRKWRSQNNRMQERIGNNSDIIIKKADKGGAVVIMNRSEYEREAAQQLSNTTFYKPLPSDPTESYQKQLQHLLKKLPEKAQDQMRTDTPLEPRPGIFYLLPKIHKPGNPGRPIISGIGTLTAGLSGYVDSLLRPYATSTPSYLRDTTDFLRKLQSIADLPDNTILATMDVEALYTNIPHKDGLQAIKNTIPDNVTANLVAELCDFVLTHNYFTFGDNVYLQISGTAMGTLMAPQYANIFMADLEQRFLSSRPLTPLLYLRYIDDIFIIWTHGKEALEEFHHDFNNFHPTINLSLVQSTQEIHFLDTTVLINNGHINTTLYRKPTDRYSYLHASSFHPDHTTRSIVYSQALRYNRICSNPSDRDRHLQDLYQAFLQLQYPPAEVKKQIDRARRVPRSHLLQDRPNKENNRTPLAVTFSPQLKPLQHIIKDLQPILKDDPTLSQILGDRPVLAYRQPPNPKQILTSNHIPHNRTTNPGTYPCNKACCQLCPHIYSGDTITAPNNISRTIRGSFTCTSSNVIYAIMCQQCPSAMYIGQTGQSLRKRVNGHKSDVKNYNIHKDRFQSNSRVSLYSTQTSSWLDFTKTRQAIYNAHFTSLQKKKDTKLSKLLQATRGHSNGPLNPPSNIVNLSNYTLSPAEAAVLSRGLSFCPSTPSNMIQFCGDLESYFRRLRLKEYFQDTSEQHNDPQRPAYQHYKKKDSRWTPPEGRNSRLDFYIECFRRRARAEIVEKQHHLPHNLSRAEHNAIHSLRNNSNIIIKKADKGGAVVIMNRSEYEQEAARQLSNTTFYKPLPSDPTESYQKHLQHLLKKLPEKAQDQIRTDTPLEPRPGIFYLLPKIHKPGNPGRPIISGIGTLTAGLSGYVDSLLRPYATSTPSYLRDTTDFLRKLQSIADLPDNTILATMDVEALYTNIPHKDGLQAIKNTIPDNVTANLVAELCDFVLTHNYFTFGDNVYLQISGTAMGTLMAPQYANIFMADLEQRFLSSRPLTPLLYLRYIDDIFIIWTHGKEALEEFHHDFNNFHPTINLSLVQSTQEIHFLDTTVLINNGHINTTLYRKPTDRYSYLHASSFHPDHTTRSIVYSQALRYNRICSNPSDRDRHLQDLYQAFLQLQYPPAEVKKQIDRARRVPRSHLLQDRPNKENNRTPLAVTFSPQLKPLQCIIKDLQPILKDDPTLSQILGERPVLAYRQPPNLKRILTNNHIPHNRTTNPGTYPCNKARCQLCPHIYSGNTITGPNNISHTIRGSFTCTSTNVIYAIMCQQCPSAMYIGQTGQSLRKRINGHKSDVKNYNIHKPVGEHFNLSGHAITDMRVAILKQKNFKSRLQRETAELEFICKLDTINLGLNRDWEWLSHYARQSVNAEKSLPFRIFALLSFLPQKMCMLPDNEKAEVSEHKGIVANVLALTIRPIKKMIQTLNPFGEARTTECRKELDNEKAEVSEHKGIVANVLALTIRPIKKMIQTLNPFDEFQLENDKLEKENEKLQKENDQLRNELEWRRARNKTDDITLAAETAHPNLSISGDKKSLKHEAQPQKVSPNPERFDSTVCVLGSEGFSSGKHYWEVDVGSSSDWGLGVARKSTERKGKLSLSPKEGFWVLSLSGKDYWAKTDPWTRVVAQKKLQKIGVYFSYQEGQVTFFSVTDMSLLFRFNDCSFSGAVYPFFKNSHKETTMRISSIKEEE
ncbi:unnamed protein product [Natator depressus]